MPASGLQVREWLPIATLVIGALLGWILNQLGQWFVSRRERRRAVARVLSDLLEIRHRLLAVPRTLEEISKHVQLPPQAHFVLAAVLGNLLPAGKLAERYNESVNLVASDDPILGFRLRSRDVVFFVLDQLRLVAASDPAATAAWPELESRLMEQVIPNLEEVIRHPALRHGWRTYFKARRSIRARPALPLGFVDSIVGAAQRSGSATPGE